MELTKEEIDMLYQIIGRMSISEVPIDIEIVLLKQLYLKLGREIIPF